MNTCDTCKHWDHANKRQASHGTHLRAACNHPKIHDDQDEYHKDGMSNNEGYRGMSTGEKFGCVHWEAK